MASYHKVDYREIISKSDLHYKGPTERRESGLPLGNGRMGSLLWSTNTSIRFQINRDDVHANGCATNSFPEIDTDYATGCGFVDIDLADFGEDVFTESETKQHLNIYDGFASLHGKEMDIRAFISSDRDVLAVEVTDNRKCPEPVRVTLRVLRFASQYDKGKRPYQYPGSLSDDAISIVRTLEHKAVSKLSVREDCTLLTQEFMERNFYCKSAVAVSVAGRRSKIKRANEMEYTITAEPGNGTFVILISSAASFDKNNNIEKDTCDTIRNAALDGFDHMLERNRNWWNGFWNNGSYVRMHSEDGDADYISENCNYFMYVMACVSRGEYMPRYGGLLWYSGGDFHTWGAMQWYHNIGCYYNALPSTGHFELMEPMFTQLSNNYESYARAAEQQWGSKGIFIPETGWFDGMEELPEYIAEEMRELYLARKTWSECSERFKEFAANKSPFDSRWNWLLGQTYHRLSFDPAPFAYVNHIFSSTAKYAYLFWLKYEYTLDTQWLRERAYPMVKGAAEFYVNFPNAVREEDGKIHLHHVNNHEPNWNCRDSIDEMSAVHGILPIAIRASEILGEDEELREVWKAFLRDLAPLPLNTHPDAIEPRQNDEPVMFTGALKPCVTGTGRGHACTNSPVLHFNLITMETDDKALLEIAKNSYMRNYNSHVHGDKVKCHVLEHDTTAAARMGHTEGIRRLVPAQLRISDPERDFCEPDGVGLPFELPNRLTLREGPEAIDAQRQGRVYQAIQDALCQGVPALPGGDPVIRVFAAWPKEWDADFRLAAPRGFTISSVINKGIVEFVEIESDKGQQCVLRNPWPEKEVQLVRDGSPAEVISGEILHFTTAISEVIVLRAKE